MNVDTDVLELALKAHGGDKAALNRLIDRLRVPLFRLAYAELRHYEDAQDAVAAAFLQIVRHVGDLRDTSTIGSWCSQIVRNEAHRLQRSSKHGRDCFFRLETHGELEDSESLLLRFDVERSLRRLPRDQARALSLFYIHRMSIAQISRQIGAPEGTIKYWLHQGRRRLAAEMEGYMPINPKPSRRKAAIIGTDLDQGTVRDMKGGLKDAGWSEILLVDHFPLIVPAKTGRAAQVGKWQLPHALKGCDCLVLDEWIGGRSSFELIALLNASAERDAATLFCLFGDKNSNPTAETTVLAAYALGVDVLLTKPFAMDEFHSLVQRVHEQTP